MAYIPQFIPTNTQILQGTLDQYQKAYDTETARMNQVNDVYSSIPTTNPYDTAEKNKIMGEFQNKVIDELDKKYNYDRANSQYAKDLAREITNLRSNPLWTLVEERGKVDSMRQKLMQERGVNYYENFDPNNAKSIADLKNWQSKDTRDLEKDMMFLADEKATSMPNTPKWTQKNGYWEIEERRGFKTESEAAKYLSTPEGQKWLNDSITSAGWNPSDAGVYGKAYNAAMSKLVGESKYTHAVDLDYQDALRDSKGKQQVDKTWKKRTNFVENIESPIKSMQELETIQDQIKNIDSKPKDQLTPQESQTRDELQRKIDHSRNIYYDTVNSPAGQKSMEKGMLIINEKISNPLVSKELLLKNLEHYFVNSTDLGRSDTTESVAGFYGAVLKSITNDFKPWFTNEKTTSTDGTLFNPPSKTKFAEETAKQMFQLANITPDKSQMREMKDEILQATKEWDKYYNGTGNYRGIGYKETIEKPINNKLKEGDNTIADVYDPPFSIESADYNQGRDVITRNLSSFDITAIDANGKKKEQVTNDNFPEIKKAVEENKSKISYHAALNSRTEPKIILTLPDNSKLELKMNLGRMGEDTMKELSKMSGLPQFEDLKYKDIKLENRTYSLNDGKDKTLDNILTTRYSDTEPFKNLSITQIKDSNGVYRILINDPLLKEVGYDKGLIVNSYREMFDELDDIYLEFYNKKK